MKAWKTVSEIDALLGSDFRPSMPTCDEEQSAGVTVDDTYVRVRAAPSLQHVLRPAGPWLEPACPFERF